MRTARCFAARLGLGAAPALLLLASVTASAAAARRPAPTPAGPPAPAAPIVAPADSVCRESPRAWHRASGDTLWLYYLAARATARIDTQGVVFFLGDSAVQLRPRPQRIGPKQAERLWDKHLACAAALKRPSRR
jgi:hypothetical protein